MRRKLCKMAYKLKLWNLANKISPSVTCKLDGDKLAQGILKRLGAYPRSK